MSEKKKRKFEYDSSGLDTYSGEQKEITPELAWNLVEKCFKYNDQVHLYETVRANENFFIGKQWEGVVANGNPTPVFNFLKRDVSFVVASISSDNIRPTVTPLANTPDTKSFIEPSRVLNEELDAITEHLRVSAMFREFTRNAAVDGDGAMFVWWDADEETGQKSKGAIKAEVIENTRVLFGNPSDRHVESQPYIIIHKRAMRGDVINKAKENGFDDWESIQTNDDTRIGVDNAKRTDDKVDLMLLLFRDKTTKEIWGYEFTHKCGVRKPWNLGIKRYPIVWLNWDYVQDSYHGMALITGLIPNQIFVNKSWASAAISLNATAIPKVLYDKTRIAKWDNRIASAIGMNGSVEGAAKVMEGASFSPQVGQFLQLAVDETGNSVGATSVALGETRPDNTSAIIALQRAAATPSEQTKLNLYEAIEDFYHICKEFIAEYYGKRYVDMPPTDDIKQAYEFIGKPVPSTVPIEYDFSDIKKHPFAFKLDVGASTYYSEIASMQTLDNLLRLGAITPVEYLERVPDGYVPGRQELVDELKQKEEEQRRIQYAQMGLPVPGEEGMMQNLEGGAAAEDPNEPLAQQIDQKEEVKGGGGFGELQRKIVAGEDVR